VKSVSRWVSRRVGEQWVRIGLGEAAGDLGVGDEECRGVGVRSPTRSAAYAKSLTFDPMRDEGPSGYLPARKSPSTEEEQSHPLSYHQDPAPTASYATTQIDGSTAFFFRMMSLPETLAARYALSQRRQLLGCAMYMLRRRRMRCPTRSGPCITIFAFCQFPP
jgi:hypothetical protein